MKKRKWWQPPRRFDDRRNERKISWLELFYDLVYVACIGQITSYVATHAEIKDISYAVLLFAFVYWSWINGTQYYELHGDDTVRARWFVFLQMLAIGAVAISAAAAFSGQTASFTISFLVIQGVMIYLLGSVSFYDRSHFRLSRPFLIYYGIAFALLFISLFTPRIAVLPLQLVAISLNMAAPVLSGGHLKKTLASRGQEFSASPTLIERFGQFTIIVLTESILSTVSGISLVFIKNMVVWAVFGLCLGIAFLLWSIYFDMTNDQDLKPGFRNYQVFVFTHFVLLAALAIFGACLKSLVANITMPASLVLLRVICLCMAAFLAATCIIGRLIVGYDLQTVNYLKQVIRLNAIVALVFVAAAFLLTGTSVIILLVVIFMLLAAPVAVGIVTWLKNENHSENNVS
jgi:low temperature requirement protein LtrA